MPTTTADGRWVVVDGRRWRASDPGLAPRFRQELVDELMAARRAVTEARTHQDAAAENVARARVQHAKIALGERGEPWWETPTDAGRRNRLRAVTIALARHRGPDRSICPSDVARAVGGDGWRRDLDDVRAVVRALSHEGVVEVVQRGEVLDLDGGWRGPIRIRILPP